jgi:hypothetical protein
MYRCAAPTRAASSACLTLRVSVVTLSTLDVAVQFTLLPVVLAECVVVYQSLVPLVVHFVAFVRMVILRVLDVVALSTHLSLSVYLVYIWSR